MKKTLKYCAAFIFTFAAGAIGSYVTLPQISTWYAALEKPFLDPPNWIFGPVWTILYIFSAIALGRIWNLKPSEKRQTWIAFFVVQLALNVLWSVLFFGFHAVSFGAGEITFLWLALLILTLESWELDRTTFWLMLPYLLWVTFATYLNFSIWWMG